MYNLSQSITYKTGMKPPAAGFILSATGPVMLSDRLHNFNFAKDNTWQLN